MSPEKRDAPRWAGRVPKWKIARLYENDARGIYDEELIDDVAYRLLDRCKSIIAVAEARRGRATCPVCDGVVEHTGERSCALVCELCDWTGSWEAYRSSFKGRHLIAPGLEPFCREYIDRLPAARTPQAKLFRIDWLIHRFHWEGTALRGQPGATSLIQGRAQDVNAFLTALSSGARHDEGIGDPRRYWSEAQLEQTSRWRKRAQRRGRI